MFLFATGIVSLIIGLASFHAEAGELVSVAVELKRSAQALQMLIGDDCLCDPAAAMTPAGKTLMIRDVKRCARDLKKLAVTWQNEVEWAVTSIPGSPEKIASIRHALETKLGLAPNDKIRFLSNSRVLHCLVFATPEPQPDLAGGNQKSGDAKESATKIKHRSPVFSEFYEKSRSDQGLYTEPGTASMPGAAPST